jgi:Mo-dependent nitrogenase C-terminus
MKQWELTMQTIIKTSLSRFIIVLVPVQCPFKQWLGFEICKFNPLYPLLIKLRGWADNYLYKKGE